MHRSSKFDSSEGLKPSGDSNCNSNNGKSFRKNIPVDKTDYITFEEQSKTFRIRCGTSLYSFCINKEKELMNLYWGPDLPDYDLRYQLQKTRKTHFTTSEAEEKNFVAGINESVFEDYINLMHKKEHSELLDEWRSNRNATSPVCNRKENAAWRLWQHKMNENKHSKGPEDPYFDTAGVDIEKKPKESLTKEAVNEFHHDSDNSSLGDGGKGHRGISKSTSTSSNLSDFHIEDDEEDTSITLPGKLLQAPSIPSLLLPSTPEHTCIRSEEEKASAKSADIRPIHRSFSTNDFSSTSTPDKRNLSYFQNIDESSRTINDEKTENSAKIGKGSVNSEYADFGTGDFRNPSFVVRDDYIQGSTISPIKYDHHRIYRGRYYDAENCHIPHIRHADSEKKFSTLVISMIDQVSLLKIKLIYVAIHGQNTIMRKAVFKNNDTRPLVLANQTNKKIIERASSFTSDFDCQNSPFHIIQLSGSWGREREIEETEIVQGIQHFGSLRGVSGHQFSPFVALSVGNFNERLGEVKGFSLIYSGNFVVECELSDLNRLRINMGINPIGFNWHLDQGQEFHTPEALLTRSDEGLGGLSREIHTVLRDYLIAPAPAWAIENPPVLLNTWEALYFNVSHSSVMELAKSATEIGVNLICVDDGWFGKRNDDKSSLGDWHVNLQKFPHGFEKLSSDLSALGIKLGVWFEPEMISEDSAIAKLHPDWILKGFFPQPSQVSRNQYVLDMSRQDIRDYLFDSIAKVIISSNVQYIKWDMNRPLTDVFSFRDSKQLSFSSYVEHKVTDPSFTVDVWQSEVFHRYVLGLYELQYRIVKAFPNVLIENCASGGGRFDPGMLFFSPQIWCSDNTDAISRLKIQYGTSIIYPMSSIGAHVSTIPNHITGSYTRARTRGFVAMCGTFGFELNLNNVNVSEKHIFREQAKIFKAVSPIIFHGDVYRLWSPFKCNFTSFMFVSKDKHSAVVFGFSMNNEHWNRIVPPLYLDGLEEESTYEVTEIMPSNVIQSPGNLRITETKLPRYQLGCSHMYFPGKVLMKVGLPIKFFTLDDSVMFLLLKCSEHQESGGSKGAASGGGKGGSGGGSAAAHKTISCSNAIHELRITFQNAGT